MQSPQWKAGGLALKELKTRINMYKALEAGLEDTVVHL